MVKQKGVALISVLLVFTIAAFISVEMFMRHKRDLARAGFTITAAQLYQYALAGEEYARQFLYEDYLSDRESIDNDHLRESWSQLDQAFDFKGGELQIQIYDAHAKYNINNITFIKEGQQRLRQITERLGVNADIAAAVVDWLDEDNKTSGFGTEDNGYLSQVPAYRAGNGPMSSLTELRLLKNMQPEEFNKLVAVMTVLPDETSVNINTASEDVLSMMGLSEATLQRAIAGRGDSGYSSVNDFIARMGKLDTVTANQFTVKSQYFEVDVRVKFAGQQYNHVSVLFRRPADGIIQLVSRRQGSFKSLLKEPSESFVNEAFY